jgi:hypothetical protein
LQRVGAWQQTREQGMSRFVIGDDGFFLLDQGLIAFASE